MKSISYSFLSHSSYGINAYYVAFLCIILLSVAACSSPAKLLEEGHYHRAMNKASKEIEKGKNVESNSNVLNEAAHRQVDITVRSNSQKLASNEVEDWIKVQNKYYSTLKDLGKANKISGGKMVEPYDRLCEQKNDLDFKIAEHYHTEGDILLANSKATAEKKFAREAYYKFHTCSEYGGETFYQDLEEKKAECFELGCVYYVTDDRDLVPSGLFLVPLPSGSDKQADCDFSMQSGFVQYSKKEDEKSEKLKEEIEISKTAITDSTGRTRYEYEYETAYGKKVVTTITVSLSKETTINVRNLTGECFVSSRSFTTTVSDTYEEIEYKGDSRAWPQFRDEKSGEPLSFRHNLEDELNKKIEQDL